MATITVDTLQNGFLQCRDATLLQLASCVRSGLGDEVRGGQLRPQPRHLLVRDDAAGGGVAGWGRGAHQARARRRAAQQRPHGQSAAGAQAASTSPRSSM